MPVLSVACKVDMMYITLQTYAKLSIAVISSKTFGLSEDPTITAERFVINRTGPVPGACGDIALLKRLREPAHSRHRAPALPCS